MSDQEEFDREQSKQNLEKFLDKSEDTAKIREEIMYYLQHNSYHFDIGDYNQLLRAICVHYPSCDDFLMAAAAAWIDMHRKKLERKV